MRSFSQNKPVGNDAETDFATRTHARQQEELQFYDSTTIKVEQTTRGIKFHAKIPPPSKGSTSGWFWIKGKRKYDPTVDSYKESQIVKILNSDAMVTTGLVCTGSAIPVKATPGKWVALQAVPVLVAGSANPAMIPQLPMPAGTDPDNTGNYWEFISPATVCVGGVPTDV